MNVSGIVSYQTGSNTNNGTTSHERLGRVGFNSRTLIKLLNASSTATNSIFHMTGRTQIPAGSWLVWDPESENVMVTNRNGFSFLLYAYDPTAENYYDYGYIEIDEDELIGGYTKNNATSAGTETDKTGIYFYFYDGNGNEIEAYGSATLKWTYGQASGGSQRTLLETSFIAGGWYATVGGKTGVPENIRSHGAGTATDPVSQNPFYQWY